MNIRPGLFVLSALVAALSGQVQAVEIEQRPLSDTPPRPVVTPAVQPQVQTQPAAQPQPQQPRPVVSAPPAAAPVAAPVAARPAATGGNPAWDVFQQLDSLQATVARLQGQLEEQQQLVDRLRQDLKVRYTDLDQRLEQLSQKPPVADAANVPPAAAASASAATATPETAPPVAPALATPAAPAPAAPAVVVAPAAAATPAPVAPPVAAEPKPVASPVAAPVRADVSADEIEKQKKAYLAAYQQRSNGPAAVIAAMTSFTQKYPDSVFSPNAYYWLGEFQLAADPVNYDAAEASFKRVIKDYDGSPKVPAAYYKLGTIADLRGKRDEARRWMNEVITRYASSPEARLAQSYLDQNPAGAAKSK